MLGGWMCEGDGITFDPAVGVVLSSGLGVQGVLVARKRAAVEAELVGVGNESVETKL